MNRESLGALLAAVNALLNSSSAVLLAIAYFAIKRKHVTLHRRCMLSAFGVSTAFLASYLARVFLTGTHKYPGTGVLKVVYLSLLSTHMLLAMAVPPLAIAALWLALLGRFPAHKRVVKWTFPIWMYVSVTGVLVYLMLYQLPH